MTVRANVRLIRLPDGTSPSLFRDLFLPAAPSDLTTISGVPCEYLGSHALIHERGFVETWHEFREIIVRDATASRPTPRQTTYRRKQVS